jgi:N-acylneuraminate cytidylyltransferase/CMP-N,N'-diacetyllegionaminic acid synthase
MKDGNTILAIIPARCGSKGIPMKNILDLCGKPLLGWPVQAAKNSKYIDKVIVSTDDQIIAEIAERMGAEVPFIRPKELANDTASSLDVIVHALDFLRIRNMVYQYLILLEPTSPLTEAQDIDSALETLCLKRDIADSIVSVSRVVSAHAVYDVVLESNGLINPFLQEDFRNASRRQDISELYFFDGSLYISDVGVLLKEKCFYHKRTLGYITPKWKSFEVDDMVDMICIEAILNNIHKIKKAEPKL